jgi:transposase
MHDRRLVGIDLGIASAHAVRVLDGEGNTLAKRRALPTVESLTQIEAAALEAAAPGTRLEVVIEPTGPAWLPIAVFFIRRGHVVYRVSSAQSADLRRYLSKHAKTNGIDADTLARIPLFHPAGVQPLELADAARAADRMTRQIALHKTRIKALVRQLMPMSPLAGKMT